jgi:DNA-binding transcriptional LysR family regulator
MSLQGLDANLLVYLEALLDEEHVGRAGRRVGLSQSGMSRALSRLRTHFEDPLFVATGRGLTATPFAAGLRAPLRQALVALEGVAQLRAAFDSARSRRVFRVASADYSTVLLLAPLDAALRSEAPHVTLEVIAIERPVSELLDRPDLDLVIGPPVTDRPRTRTKQLYVEEFCLVAHPRHPLLRGRLTANRYAGASHVLVAPGGQPGSLVDSALEAEGLSRAIFVRLPSFLAVPALLASGLHVCALPRRLAQLFGAQYGLALRDLPFPSPTFPVTLSFPSERESDPAHRFLRDRLSAIASAVRSSPTRSRNAGARA